MFVGIDAASFALRGSELLARSICVSEEVVRPRPSLHFVCVVGGTALGRV